MRDWDISRCANALSRYLSDVVDQPLLLLSVVVPKPEDQDDDDTPTWCFYLCGQIHPVDGIRSHEPCPVITASVEAALMHAKEWLGCTQATTSWFYIVSEVDFAQNVLPM